MLEPVPALEPAPVPALAPPDMVPTLLLLPPLRTYIQPVSDHFPT